MCQALAAKGMRVGVVYNSSEASGAGGGRRAAAAPSWRAPTSADPAQVEALVKQLQEVAGRVDVLVNNAGLQPRRPDLQR